MWPHEAPPTGKGASTVLELVFDCQQPNTAARRLANLQKNGNFSQAWAISTVHQVP
jgi:hypothetical protein